MNMLKLVAVCCVLTVIVSVGDAARILGIVPTPSYSHQEVFQPIWKELSLRGHQVTTITTDPLKDPKLTNLTEIDLHFFYDFAKEEVPKFIDLTVIGLLFQIVRVYEGMGLGFLSYQPVQNLIKDDDKKFDVVMVEYGVLSMLSFAKRFNAPLIVMSSVDVVTDLQVAMGNPTHPVLYPDGLIPNDDNTSLYDRLMLTGYRILVEIVKQFLVLPSQQKLVDKYFGSHYPLLQDLHISLALVNSDPIFHKVKPLIPTIVQIGGGSHRTAPKPLPKELKDTLDAAEQGFIYFSLGSNVKSKDLSEKTRNVILETFAELPYTVLWKFELNDLPNKPKNVITSKWFPQQDVFKHPNLRLFITQGGLQSMDEAIYDHIPMLGIPFIGDQSFNVNKMVKKGLGLFLDYRTLRKDEFKARILELINNPKYRNKIKELAELALDQPMTGLEKAIWWTEYVIRHNGTEHLRSPLLDIPFYQYYLLDVIAVLTSGLIILISVIFLVFKLLFKLIQRVTPSKKIKTN